MYMAHRYMLVLDVTVLCYHVCYLHLLHGVGINLVNIINLIFKLVHITTHIKLVSCLISDNTHNRATHLSVSRLVACRLVESAAIPSGPMWLLYSLVYNMHQHTQYQHSVHTTMLLFATWYLYQFLYIR